jgi:hypothetical protein
MQITKDSWAFEKESVCWETSIYLAVHMQPGRLKARRVTGASQRIGPKRWVVNECIQNN